MPYFFLQMNPLGKIPLLKKGKFVLTESAAICRYVANTQDSSDKLYPKDPKVRGIVEQRIYFNQCTFYPRFQATVVSIAIT